MTPLSRCWSHSCDLILALGTLLDQITGNPQQLQSPQAMVLRLVALLVITLLIQFTGG
ncbi:MAG: hypothetical protein KDA58_02950 [Planctomycetaceae bacterium]|nr:hypothetical protein [Planctomycetaceae bacterium]